MLQYRKMRNTIQQGRANVDFDDDENNEITEIGSDDLLSDDNLRLPESANILVRIHAVRAWLNRRRDETLLEVGETEIALQEKRAEMPEGIRLRRSDRLRYEEGIQQLQKELVASAERSAAYDEAQELLEECITHVSGERILVEYYLALEELMLSQISEQEEKTTPRQQALADVQHRVEHVGAPNEE